MSVLPNQSLSWIFSTLDPHFVSFLPFWYRSHTQTRIIFMFGYRICIQFGTFSHPYFHKTFSNRLAQKCWKKWNGNWHWESPRHQVIDGWERLLTGTLNWAQDTGSTERSGDQEKDGKMTSTNSSNKNLKILKNPIESSNQTNKAWISIAKDRGSWALLEEAYTMTVEEQQEMRKKEKITKADQRGTLMEWDWVTKKQPTSHNKRENETTTTGNAAAPQFRTACINKMMHLKNNSRSTVKYFVMNWCSSSRSAFRTSWWVDAWSPRTMRWVLYKEWRYWKFGWKTGAIDELWYLPTSSSGACLLSWLPWPASPLLVSQTSTLCCSESEDSSDLNTRIYSSNSLCFLTCSFMPLSWFDVLHTVLNSGLVHTLPIEQASSVQQQILFFAGSWPLHSRL